MANSALQTVADLAAVTTVQFPVPFNVIVCGEPDESSVKLTTAVSVPVVFGAKTIDTEQFAPGARLAPQLFVCWNDVGLAPVICTEVIFRVAVPGF